MKQHSMINSSPQIKTLKKYKQISQTEMKIYVIKNINQVFDRIREWQAYKEKKIVRGISDKTEKPTIRREKYAAIHKTKIIIVLCHFIWLPAFARQSL